MAFCIQCGAQLAADVYLQVGDEAAADGDWEVAEASYREARRLGHPGDHWVLAELGM